MGKYCKIDFFEEKQKKCLENLEVSKESPNFAPVIKQGA